MTITEQTRTDLDATKAADTARWCRDAPLHDMADAHDEWPIPEPVSGDHLTEPGYADDHRPRRPRTIPHLWAMNQVRAA